MVLLRGLLFGLPAALAASFSDDATALVQQRTALSDMEETEEMWEERSFPSFMAQMYAFDEYTPGEIAEGRSKDGSWLPVFIYGRGQGNSWNIHVSDSFPGYDLPNVPSNLIRKSLAHGMSDWYVDNSVLKHKGLGVKYRHEKDMHNKTAQFAPWGSIIVGADEDDWVKTALGYVPKEVHGAKVLVKKERKGYTASMPYQFHRLIEEQRQKQALELAAASQKAQELATTPAYEVGEHVDMQTRHGDWYHARISDKTRQTNVYDVIVMIDEYSVYPVRNVPAARLKKVGTALHVPQPNDSPICQKEGCIVVNARTQQGDEVSLHVSEKMGVDMLMKMACNKLKIEWGECLTRVTFSHNGETLKPDMHVKDTSLENQAMVDVNIAPAVPRTPLEDA